MALPILGVGVIYSPALKPLLEAEPDLACVLEVEPETLWTFTGDPAAPYRPAAAALAGLLELPQPKLVHGVGFPVGGSRPPDPRHLPLLVDMIDTLASPWASEHLAFNEAAGDGGAFATGFLLPPLQSPAGVAAARASIRSVASRLPVPFAVETGVNYLQRRPGEMADGAFVAAVAESADCGLVLDLHNLWANQRNGRMSVEAVLAELPLERVWEVHIAGGSEFRGYWLDAHSGEVPAPLLELACRVLPELPALRALIFEILPSFLPRFGFDGVRRQLSGLHELWEQRATSRRLIDPRAVAPAAPVEEPGFTAQEWEDALGSLVVGRPAAGPAAAVLAHDPGVEVLRQLVWNFRSGSLVETLGLTCRLLLLHGGDPLTRGLFDDFFAEVPPQLFASVEAEAFGAFLARRRPAVPYLDEVLGFDLAALRAALEDRPQLVPFAYEPASLLEPLARCQLPEAPIPGRFEVEVTPDLAAHHAVTTGLLSSS